MRQTVNLPGGIIVEKFNIIGCENWIVTAAWEPRAGHTTITHLDGVPYGKVGQEPLPAELAAMPRGIAREKAVREWQAAKYERAYALILAAFPEMVGGKRDMGQIELL